jgi:tight adherence protein B
MGMTFTEYFLFTFGSLCVAFFLFRTLGPFFLSRLDNTADTTSRRLREDFMSFSREQVRGFLLSAGLLVALAVIAATGDVFWMMVVGSTPALLCGVFVRHVRVKRRKRIVSQLPAFLEILAGHVKAGHSIPESLQEAIPLIPSGIREEVSWLCQAIRLGTPLPDALLVWEQRMSCEELSLIVRPLRIAIPAGGNLYDLLIRCRDILRTKMRQEEKMRSMTAQARFQALILTLLPPGFILVLSKIEPEYLARCLDTVAGKTLLGIACVLQLLGWVFIRRIMTASK